MASWELSTDPKGGGARLSGGRGWAAWPGSLPILLELDKGVGKAAQVPRMAFFALRRRPCMSKSDKYQRFAEECLEIAQTAKDNQARQCCCTWRKSGSVWRRNTRNTPKEVEEREPD
jgi:hypothetical protein